MMNNEQPFLNFDDVKKSTLCSCIERSMQDDSCIEDMIFENEDITETDISSIEFENVRFVKCDLKKCNFSRSRFYHADFINCNLSLSDFSKTFWKKVTIIESNVVGGKFVESLIKETNIRNSIFDYSNFFNASLDNCLFNESKFAESSFTESKLKKVHLKKVVFTGADFFKTSLRGIDLSDCIIDGIKISADLFELKGAKINPEQAMELIRVFDIEIV